MLEKLKNWFNKEIVDYFTRNITAVILISAISISLWIYYGKQFWDIAFAVLLGILVEYIALLVSSYACYYYTNKKSTDMGDSLKGRIFIGVHVLFGLIVSMAFWSIKGG